MLSIVVNCVFLALDDPPESNEYVFLGIYTVEMLLKMFARGFIFNKHTYLRDLWNWLDFVVIILGYTTILLQSVGVQIGNLNSLRTFRVLRALKTISIFPGLKTIVNALLRSMRMFIEVLALTVFCMMMFALFGLQVYMGLLRNKCVKMPDLSSFGNSSGPEMHAYYAEFTKNETNWEIDQQGNIRLCGNTSGAGICSPGYKCLPDIGDNPNFGYTSFDHFGWAMLTSFQLITLDYWENVYNMIIRINGPWNILFFILIVFFGSFYLVNLMLAVVTMSYEEEALNDGKELERQKKAKKKAARKKLKKESVQKIDFDPARLKMTVSLVDIKSIESKQKQKEEQSAKDKEEHIAGLQQVGQEDETVNKSEASVKTAVSRNSVKSRNSINSAKSKKSAVIDNIVTTNNKSPTKTKPNSAANKSPPKSRPSETDSPSKKNSKKVSVKIAPVSNASSSTGTKKGSPQISKLTKSTSHDNNPKPYATPVDSGMGSTDRLIEALDAIEQGGVTNPCYVSDDNDDKTAKYDRTSEDSGSSSRPSPNHSSGERPTPKHGPAKVDSKTPHESFSRSHTVNIPSAQVSISNTRPPLTKRDSELSSNFDDGQSEESDGQSVVVVDDKDREWKDRNCVVGCKACCKTHYIPWLRVQNGIYNFVMDPLFEMFIMLCIVLNTMAMALEFEGMTPQYHKGLEITNYIFSGIFILEAILKILSMPRIYWKSAWNVFDFVIVLASILDFIMGQIEHVTNAGLGVVRVCRLFRVFRLAQSWTTMRILLSIIFSTLHSLGNLTLILLIFMYMFAVIGMSLFKSAYTESNFAPDEVPRWNFIDFEHSLMMVFRVICGEWIEPLWDCMRASNELCMIVFLPTLFIGNYMVLNLFLALLLNSFATDALKKKESDKEETNRLKLGWQRIKNIVMSFRKKKDSIVEPEVESVTENTGSQQDGIVVSNGKVSTGTTNGHTVQDANSTDVGSKAILENKQNSKHEAEADEKSKKSGPELMNNDSDGNKKDENGNPIIEDCCPIVCYQKCCPSLLNASDQPWEARWKQFRVVTSKVVDHKAFETFILLLIAASSISLAAEDIYMPLDAVRVEVLYYLNIVFAILFTIEMFLKWIAYGFKKYFTSFWTILDFIIVVVSIASLIAEHAMPDGANISAFRALRTLRAFRPLRAVSRWQGMKIVVNALVFAVPSIFNVLVVCAIFWLIFSIMGMNLFMGKFYKCTHVDNGRFETSVVANKSQCLELAANDSKIRWQNSDVNFDNVGNGLLALLQVATFEGWMEVMADAIDSRGRDLQPTKEANLLYYIYFVIFIIFGSFFTLNLFIGVIIDNFNMLKKKYEGTYLDVFLTSSQRNYYNTIKKLGNRKPQKTIKRPKNKVMGFFFDIAVSTKFELAIVVLIFLNMCAMAVEHYKQTQTITVALDIINVIFTTIFTLEAVIKIIGMRYHYFRRAWNVFDFIIVLLSIIGVILDDLLKDIFITPTLLRVVRIFRIGRVLRLIKAAKGIRKLLFALIISVPALFNIGALLFVVVFIFAIVGMSSFGRVKHNGFINDLVNFETFERSVLVLFRLTTSAGWNDILGPLFVQPPDCNDTHYIDPRGVPIAEWNGNCGLPWLASGYMILFVMITFLIVINMYIAVILENFNQAHEQEEVGVTEDDFEMFYVIWERYDPHASQFIKYEQLSDFVADLDLPLGLPKPNDLALVAFNLPIVQGEKLHCLDILMALVKRLLGDPEQSKEFDELKVEMEEKFRDTFPFRVETDVIATTMQRKKEDVAAKTLQRAWRKHKAQQKIRNITALALAQRPNSSNLNSATSSLANTPRRGLSPVSRTSNRSATLQVPTPSKNSKS
ncbi:sodium channel protein 1 brain-like isoform X1 [Tubulanus polymorphus]|uniref:sodium channel protein 1 brain-like isoform X1 n=1 Tax=Tubulanus polymorphus TaxID=672921 RepID=UPI003DA4F623